MDIIEYVEWSDSMEVYNIKNKDPLVDEIVKQGYDAFRAGQPKFPNPYVTKSDIRYSKWKQGWKLGLQHKNQGKQNG